MGYVDEGFVKEFEGEHSDIMICSDTCLRIGRQHGGLGAFGEPQCTNSDWI